MPLLSLLFFSTDAPPTEIYTLSLHDALPISPAPHRRDGTARMQIDRRVFELYDEYCHGRIDRREFLARAGALTVAGVSALAMAQALLPRYAQAQTIAFTDERMKAQYVNYPSPGGNSGSMRGYLARPAG